MTTRRNPTNLPAPIPDPAAEAEAIRQSVGLKARFLPVISNDMVPDFKIGDYAVVTPCDRYERAGVYVLDFGLGPVLRNAEKIIGADEIRSVPSNPRYTEQRLTAAVFNAAVCGKVFAVVHILDAPAMERVARAASS